MSHLYAVLTGDLIGSTKASPDKLEATIDNIAATARLLTDYTGEDTRFTRHRGDGWQMVLSPAFYLRAVALILARLKKDGQTLPTRIGIGIGTIDTLGTTDLRDAQGLAFVHSGRALDSLTRDHALMLSGDNLAPDMRGAIAWSDAAMLPMFSFIARRWSAQQAQAMAMALADDNQTQATIAAKLGITRQALNLRLTGAGYGPIHTAITFTERTFNGILDQRGRDHA